MKSILDPTFRYTASFNTDIRKTFARVRRDFREAASLPLPQTDGGRGKVASILGRTAKIRARSV